jgi:alginate O-acetyltransferase complex protein AlgI
MKFNSFAFLLFGCLFFLVWPLVRKKNTSRWIVLIISSALFYGWWDWRFLFLIALSGSIDFFAALAMERWPVRKKLFLIASIVGNCGTLGLFKYLFFVTTNLDYLFSFFHCHIPILSLTLPVGISFYTFQSMSYTIDVYKGNLKPTHHPLHFFSYIIMFPQLVAGPIIRASDLLPQLCTWKTLSRDDAWEGLNLILRGYFKKVVIADTLGFAVNKAYGAGTLVPSAPYWMMIIIMFAFQIYCDFSGYSQIARGLARWMGYDFARNFDHPYISRSLREFWQRWHISLSTWFRDYVYIPLGGSRKGKARTYLNVWITMLLSALWHGAAWNFVFWGIVHALFLTIERITRWPERLRQVPLGNIICWFVVMAQVLFAWIFFRAVSFSQAVDVIGIIFHPGTWTIGPVFQFPKITYLVLLIGMVRELYIVSGIKEWMHLSPSLLPVVQMSTTIVLFIGVVFFQGPSSTFIYFQF